jgi:tetratricopeptide (TPR) repeat protein
MNIKRIALAIAVAFSAQAMSAQSIAEIKKMYEFGRFETVKKLTSGMAATNPEANYYLGLAELNLSHFDVAQQIFAKQPTDLANMSGTARVLYARKKNDEALTLLKTIAAKAKKKDVLPLKYATDAIVWSGVDASPAVEWCTKIIAAQPTGENYMTFGDVYMNVPNGGGNASKQFNLALANKAEPTYVYTRLGDLWYSARQYDSAVANYDRAVKADPTNPIPYLRFSESNYKVSKFDAAKQNLEKYLEYSDKAMYDRLKLANIYFVMGDYATAANKFQDLLPATEYEDFIYRGLMISKLEAGKIDEASAAATQYLAKAKPESITGKDYLYLSRIFMKTPGKEADAMTYLNKATEKDASIDNSIIFRAEAEKFRDAKDWKQASTWYNLLVEKVKPELVSSVDLFYGGYCNYASKDYVTATKMYTKMVEQFPTEPSGWYYLGLTQAATDNDAKAGAAIASYNKYLELAPQDAAQEKDQKVKAYTYLLQHFYGKKEKEKCVEYSGKILSLDANNQAAKQISDFYKNGGATNAVQVPAQGVKPATDSGASKSTTPVKVKKK